MILYEIYFDDYEEFSLGIFSTEEKAEEELKGFKERYSSSSSEDYKIRQRILDQMDY